MPSSIMALRLSSAVAILSALASALTAAAEDEIVIEDFSSPGRFGADHYDCP